MHIIVIPESKLKPYLRRIAELTGRPQSAWRVNGRSRQWQVEPGDDDPTAHVVVYPAEGK